MTIETENIETVALKPCDSVVYAIDFCIMSRTSQGSRILLNRVDTLVATQCECDGVSSYAREAVEDDDFAAWLGRCNVLCYFAVLC